jgi:hypothetical protein
MNQQVIDWLLEKDQPSIRYYTLVDILDRRENDPEVREAYSNIPRRGWAADILRLQKPKGYWEQREPDWRKDTLGWIEFLYRPKFVATNWRASFFQTSDSHQRTKESRKLQIYSLTTNLD